jgi:hypothetical protein
MGGGGRWKAFDFLPNRGQQESSKTATDRGIKERKTAETLTFLQVITRRPTASLLRERLQLC